MGMNRLLLNAFIARAAAAAAVLSLMATVAGAQAPAGKDKPKQEGWETGLNAGLSLTRGNSKTLLVNGGILSEYKKGANEFRLDIQGAYGESSTTPSGGSNSTEQTTVQNAKGVADYRRLFSERDYGYVNGTLMHDEMAKVDYRLIVGPGVGRYFLKDNLQALSAEAGVAYLRQRLEGDTHNSANLRLAQRYEIKPMAGSKLWESVEYLPAFNDFGNYLVTFEVGAEAPMTGRLNLRIVLQDQYNSQPAPDKDKNDVQLLAGLGFKL